MEKQISHLLKYGTLLSTYGLIGSVLLQIFARFFLQNTPPWTEEASRLFFIYATAFAAGLALRNKYYVHLDVFFEQLSAKTKRALLVVIPVLILFLFLVVTVFSVQFIVLGHQEFSPSMKIRMSFVFFSMFIMGASMSYYALLDLMKVIKKREV